MTEKFVVCLPGSSSKVHKVSPFKFMIGRKVSSLLDLIKARWEEKIPKAENLVVDYVLSFIEWLKMVMSISKENLAETQKKFE